MMASTIQSTMTGEEYAATAAGGGGGGISEFYRDRSIFITGASGFIGKQLMEKLLRSCPHLRKVYILLRDNRHMSAAARLQHILSSTLFCRLRNDCPDFEAKIHVIQGDIVETNLGISEKDREMLVSEVSIVFHLAATVSFNEPLRVAVNVNIVGLRRVLELCKLLPKLAACVHVSTAYANCQIENEVIRETVYAPPLTPNKILDAMEWMTDDMLGEITQRVIAPRPNTYTFAKAIAEQLLLDEKAQLPIAIFRPSIVTASLREPIPGWVDNLNGATGVITAVGSGFVKALYGGQQNIADIVPVDLAANVLIAVAWHTATQWSVDEVPVYNFTSGTLNPLTWGEIGSYITDLFRKYPMENPIWIPKGYVTENWFYRTFSIYGEVYLRLLGIDLLRRLVGKKPRMLRIHRNVRRMVTMMEYFTSRQWNWSNDNVVHLIQSLSDADRQLFNFDVKSIHWKDYFESYCLGIRQHTLHQELKTLPDARRILKWFFLMRRFCLLTSCLLLVRLVITRAETASRLWKFMMSMITAFLQKMPIITRAA